ncbi:Rha family transcriptional regulator [Xanthobacter sp. VNH20]|uniref:Rha family transcriptional regulator n=1 Tax=Xanthobacter sp. VNH20 TaxID=3156616 RepID=UPI0032B38809
MNAHEGSQFPLILKAPSLGPSLSMSSADIAEVTEKRHGDVIRDIKKMLSELYSDPGGKFEGPLIDDAVLRHLGKSVTWEKDARGYVTMIHLDKEHTLTLVSGYDVRLRKRMVDKLAEIEALSAQPAKGSHAASPFHFGRPAA